MDKEEIKEKIDDLEKELKGILEQMLNVDSEYTSLLEKKSLLLKKTNINVVKIYNFVWIVISILLLKPIFINNMDWFLQLLLYLIAVGYGKIIISLAREITLGKIENYKIKNNLELKKIEEKIIELFNQFKLLDQKRLEIEQLKNNLINKLESMNVSKMSNSYVFKPDEEKVAVETATKGITRKLVNDEILG